MVGLLVALPRLKADWGAFAMRQREPSEVNQIQLYRPPCPTCGSLTMLVSIEPPLEPGHDLRTFKCEHCGHSEVMKIKFK